MKPISTKLHGVLDYLTAATMLALPRLLRWDASTTRLLTGAALGTVGYSLLTRYELGLVPVIPMKGHLALDAGQSVALASAPFLFIDTRKAVTAALVGMSVFEAIVVLNSRSE